MKIRLISALIALAIAVVGVALIASYVQDADHRALAGAETRDVLVVSEAIPAGTPTEQLADYVQLKTLPIMAIADEAIADLSDFSSTVTSVGLVSGEQLLSSRLVDPATLEAGSAIPVPDGLEEVTIQLGAAQVVGGEVKAGDAVGVFISFAESPSTPGMTRLAFQEVLVTRVQGGPREASADAPSTEVMLVTLARSAADSESIIFAAQYGSIWLSKQSRDAPDPETSGVTRADVFR
ncbi:Flp pilus assembly protein CpaB [Glaciibacter superstes]|uniref:Flp pilus assembly protein CpaB n=1 Tax=Glaciibacter superstes TaxID=501023 RepID=UPI0003B548DE|nr:RcpC/CpaB family pilus assembly protein [Glaciibacter superstes]